MFVLNTDGKLVAMKQKEFVKETDFQKLLEEYPTLLSGELIDPEDTRLWLLVAREMTITSEENGPGWWSVDHLFLDQDGIPTIVEVKRVSDTRLRREVIAQILDYAANGLARWRANDLRSRFESECEKRNEHPTAVYGDAFGPKLEYDAFWALVKTNLEAKRIRMLLVADVIPREVKAVIEFLNAQMDPAEILALELRQYTGDNGLRTIVPTIFGQTEAARSTKAPTSGQTWTEERVLAELESQHGAAISNVARKIVARMHLNNSIVTCGRGKVDGSINSAFYTQGQKVQPLSIYTVGRMYVNAGYCMTGNFADPAKRLDWLDRINKIEGIQLALKEDKFPPISLDKLTVGSRLEQFLAVMDWFRGELDSQQPPVFDAPDLTSTATA